MNRVHGEMTSWLKFGVALFVIGGIFDMFIGASTPIVTRLFGPAPTGALVISAHADTLLLGVSPAEFVESGPGLALYRALIDLVGFLLLAFGSFQTTIAYYGLRRGFLWAWWSLIAVDMVFVIGWIVVLVPYLQRGIAISISELPPNLLVPAFLLVPQYYFPESVCGGA